MITRESYINTDLQGVGSLFLKGVFDSSCSRAMRDEKVARLVVRKFEGADPAAVAEVGEQVEQLRIEDDRAPNDFALPFTNLVALSLAKPPIPGFLSAFPRLKQCRLDRLAALPNELRDLRSLAELVLGDGCKFKVAPDFRGLDSLEKLVLAGASLPKGLVALNGPARLKFIGMDRWAGRDLGLLQNLPELEECVLTYFAKAKTLHGLTAFSTLKRLHLASFPVLGDVGLIASMQRLRVLILEDCPCVSSLAAAVDHPALEEIHLWGRTKIADGALKRLKEGRRLGVLKFNNRAHYDLSADV